GPPFFNVFQLAGFHRGWTSRGSRQNTDRSEFLETRRRSPTPQGNRVEAQTYRKPADYPEQPEVPSPPWNGCLKACRPGATMTQHFPAKKQTVSALPTGEPLQSACHEG